MYSSSNRVLRNARPTESLVFVLGVVGFLLGNFGGASAISPFCKETCDKHRPNGGTLRCDEVNDPDCSRNCVFCSDDYCINNTSVYNCPGKEPEEPGLYDTADGLPVPLKILYYVISFGIAICCCGVPVCVYYRRRNRAPVMANGGGYSMGAYGAAPAITMPSMVTSTTTTQDYSPSPAPDTQPIA